MQRNKLYLFILIACFAGYSWLFFSLHHQYQIQNNELTVCFFKNVTDIPCPSCGTTRAVLKIANGNFLDSILLNPFGILVALIMLVCPIWITFDCIFKKDTFYQFYKNAELFLRKKIIAIPLIVLIIANWIWNINKNL